MPMTLKFSRNLILSALLASLAGFGAISLTAAAQNAEQVAQLTEKLPQ